MENDKYIVPKRPDFIASEALSENPACPQNMRGSQGSDRLWLVPRDLVFSQENLYSTQMQPVLLEIKSEVLRAKSKYPENFNSHHEAYAVVKEEIDEYWDEVKKNDKTRDLAKMRTEAIQSAAMLVRHVTELLK